jgi:hypothetical protein
MKFDMDIQRLFVLLVLFCVPFVSLHAAPPATEQIPKNLTVPSDSASLQKKAGQNAKAKEAKRSPEVSKLTKEAETLKKSLIKLNRDLYIFEEKLLYPTETQLAVFLSLRSGTSFTLDSVEILLDDKLVATHLYEENELRALGKGGIQKVYLGSLADGRHKLTAQFNGQNADKSYFRRKKALKFTKENKAKYIQIEISENSAKREPLFKVKQW